MKARFPAVVAMHVVALLGLFLVALQQSAAAVPTNPDPWPRQMQITGGTLTVYQPQVDSWDGGFLKFRAAVAVKPSDGGQEVFGVIRASAHTLVDRTARMVSLFNFSLLQIDFPSLPDHGQRYYADLGRLLPAATTRISLDRLQGFLAVQKLTAKTVAVKNDPPEIIVSYRTAVLVPVSGYPALRTVAGTDYQRVVNTRALILYGPGGGIYLHVYDGWMVASALDGPWHVAQSVPAELNNIATDLAKKDVVDLLQGNGKTKPSLAVSVPTIHVAYKPTELVVFRGQPQFVPIANTMLLWASNSLNDVIIDTDNNDYYVLISGRWFRARSLAGPWSYVPGNELPADFRRIPPGVPSAEVLASVAGTSQAKEALIADSIPQTALIPRARRPELHPGLRRRAAVPRHRRDAAAICREFARRHHRGQSLELLCAAPGRLVHLHLGARALGRGELCSRRHLFDPGELIPALRDLCAGLLGEPGIRRGRLYPRLCRNGGGARRRRRLRHGL